MMAARGLSTVATAAVLFAFSNGAVLAQAKIKEKPVDAAVGLQIIADARSLCDRVAGSDASVTDDLEAAGWQPEIDANGEIPYYHEIEGSRDYPGVGRADIWGFIELYPSHTIGYCTFEIVAPDIDMPVAEMNSMDGLTGGVEYTDEGVFTSLSNSPEPHHLFIQAHQTEASFFYQVTDIIARD